MARENEKLTLLIWLHDPSNQSPIARAIKGKYVLRACNVNHRSSKEDFDWLVAEVNRLGVKLLSEVK